MHVQVAEVPQTRGSNDAPKPRPLHMQFGTNASASTGMLPSLSQDPAGQLPVSLRLEGAGGTSPGPLAPAHTPRLELTQELAAELASTMCLRLMCPPQAGPWVLARSWPGHPIPPCTRHTRCSQAARAAPTSPHPTTWLPSPPHACYQHTSSLAHVPPRPPSAPPALLLFDPCQSLMGSSHYHTPTLPATPAVRAVPVLRGGQHGVGRGRACAQGSLPELAPPAALPGPQLAGLRRAGAQGQRRLRRSRRARHGGRIQRLLGVGALCQVMEHSEHGVGRQVRRRGSRLLGRVGLGGAGQGAVCSVLLTAGIGFQLRGNHCHARQGAKCALGS